MIEGGVRGGRGGFSEQSFDPFLCAEMLDDIEEAGGRFSSALRFDEAVLEGVNVFGFSNQAAEHPRAEEHERGHTDECAESR